MIKAELMEDGKTVATEGNGEAVQVLTELMYLLNTLRIQIRASCDSEKEEAMVLTRLNGILGAERELTVRDLKQLADSTGDKVLKNGIRKSLKYIERFDRATKKERAAMGKALVEDMKEKMKEVARDGERLNEEEALKRALEEDQE